jgi:hypothetical protein
MSNSPQQQQNDPNPDQSEKGSDRDDKDKDDESTTAKMRQKIKAFSNAIENLYGKFDKITPRGWQNYCKAAFASILILMFINVSLGPYYFAKMFNDFTTGTLKKNLINKECVDYITVRSMNVTFVSYRDYLKIFDPRSYLSKYNLLLFVSTSLFIVLLSITLVFAKDTTIRIFAIVMLVYGLMCFSINVARYNETATTVTIENNKYKQFNDLVKNMMPITGTASPTAFMNTLTQVPENTFNQEKIIETALNSLLTGTVSAPTSNNAAASASGSSTAPPTPNASEDDKVARILFAINMYKHYCKIGPSDDARVHAALQQFAPAPFLIDLGISVSTSTSANTGFTPDYSDYLLRQYSNIRDHSADYITHPALAGYPSSVKNNARTTCSAKTAAASALYSTFYPDEQFYNLRKMTVTIGVLQLIPVLALIALTGNTWFISLMMAFLGVPQ